MYNGGGAVTYNGDAVTYFIGAMVTKFGDGTPSGGIVHPGGEVTNTGAGM